MTISSSRSLYIDLYDCDICFSGLKTFYLRSTPPQCLVCLMSMLNSWESTWTKFSYAFRWAKKELIKIIITCGYYCTTKVAVWIWLICFVSLFFQDLLQLQYEGVAVMQMFDKAKVNVNLLIFMLNKKFYGKK